jgi:mannose-6-phosphate isomerase-like protein (cupin superfamily)
MADYTKINFADIEDSASGRGFDIEARLARKQIQSEHLGVSQFSYGSGVRPSYGHRHREQEEVYVITGGGGRVRLDDEIMDVKRGDVIRVAPQVVRAFEAGPSGLEMIAIGSDRPEDGDGEMVHDFWTD